MTSKQKSVISWVAVGLLALRMVGQQKRQDDQQKEMDDRQKAGRKRFDDWWDKNTR